MRTALICLLLTLALAQHQLNYLEVQDSSVTLDQLIEKFTELQPELYRKVFQHYIVEKISQLKTDGISAKEIRDKILTLLTDSTGPLLEQLSEYMRKKLFDRLGS